MAAQEIYLLQGNKDAYIEQLWELVLEHDAGDLKVYRELKHQYSEEVSTTGNAAS